MKRNIYLLITFALFTSSLISQEKDSLIQLYSGIGDTIDFIDREIFELYPDIDGYKYAQLYSRDNKFFVSKITYSKYGKLRDKVFIEDISKFTDLQMKLYQIILENEKKFRLPLNAIVFTSTGKNFNGNLEMFSKRYIYLNSNINYITENSSPFKFKTLFQKVDSLRIQAKKPNLLPYVGYGSLIGAGLGAAWGLIWINTTDLMVSDIAVVGLTTLIGWGTGALLGLVVGSFTPMEFITIRLNSPNDILKLKDYTPYYFNYRKSLEESYVELE